MPLLPIDAKSPEAFLDAFVANTVNLGLRRLPVGTRFFAATVMARRLYPEGIGERGPWDSQRLVYWPEEAVRIALRQGVDRLAWTVDDLEVVIRSSERGLPAIRVWIHEGLEERVRALWLQSRSAD